MSTTYTPSQGVPTPVALARMEARFQDSHARCCFGAVGPCEAHAGWSEALRVISRITSRTTVEDER